MWGKGVSRRVLVTAKADIPKGKPVLFVWNGVALVQHVEEGPVYSDFPIESVVPLHDEVTDEILDSPILEVEE